MKTAVEHLKKELIKFIPKSLDILFNHIIEEAKELEKQQMKTIWSASYENMRKTFGTSNYTPIDFEEYYNENYN